MEEYKGFDVEKLMKAYTILSEEIRKNPHDMELEKLKKDLLNAMKNYSEWRRKWSYMSYAEKSEWDAERTKCHNAFIGCVDKLAFYMEEQGMYAYWRDILGNDRKIIGDFACYMEFVLAVSNR